LETENKNGIDKAVFSLADLARASSLRRRMCVTTGTSARPKTSSFLFEIDVFACFLVKLVSNRVYIENTNRSSRLRGGDFFHVGWNTAGFLSAWAGSECFKKKFNVCGARRLPASD
jgi:hypothetical protein